MRSRQLFALGLFAMTACAAVVGLDDYEVAPEGADGASADAANADSSTSPPEVLPDCGVTRCQRPDGFVLVGDGGAPCPLGYTERLVVTDPDLDAAAGACACEGCSADASASACASGSLTTGLGNNCATAGITLANPTPGACGTTNGQTNDHSRVDPPHPTAPPCTAEGKPVRASVTTAARRICTPRAEACASDACNPPASFDACLIADGDAGCPNGYSRTLVGDDVAIACAACTCTATVTCSGSVDLYSNDNCSGTPVTLTSGTCTATNAGIPVKSYRWRGNPPSVACTTTPPATPKSLTLTKPQTICCPP